MNNLWMMYRFCLLNVKKKTLLLLDVTSKVREGFFEKLTYDDLTLFL